MTEVVTKQDGKIFTGSHDGTVRVRRPCSGLFRSRSAVLFRGFAVEALALSDDGVFMVIGGGTRVLCARTDDSQMIDELSGLEQTVSNLAIEPGSRRILVSANDGTLTVWKPGDGVTNRIPPPRPSKAFPAAGSGGHRGDAGTAFLVPRIVATARAHGVLEIVDVDAGTVLASAPFDHPPVSVAAAQGGKTILVGDRAGDVHCLEWSGMTS